jgi:hypothetical protein
MTKAIPFEFTALRVRAKARRDTISREARAEYEANLLEIAKFEQNLLGTYPCLVSRGNGQAEVRRCRAVEVRRGDGQRSAL